MKWVTMFFFYLHKLGQLATVPFTLLKVLQVFLLDRLFNLVEASSILSCDVLDAEFISASISKICLRKGMFEMMTLDACSWSYGQSDCILHNMIY